MSVVFSYDPRLLATLRWSKRKGINLKGKRFSPKRTQDRNIDGIEKLDRMTRRTYGLETEPSAPTINLALLGVDWSKDAGTSHIEAETSVN